MSETSSESLHGVLVDGLLAAHEVFQERMASEPYGTFRLGNGEYLDLPEADDMNEELVATLKFRAVLLLDGIIPTEPLVLLPDEIEPGHKDYQHGHEISVFSDGRIIYRYNSYIADSGSDIFDSRDIVYEASTLPDSIKELIRQMTKGLQTVWPVDRVVGQADSSERVFDSAEQAIRLEEVLAELSQRVPLKGGTKIRAGANKFLSVEDVQQNGFVFAGALHEFKKGPVFRRPLIVNPETTVGLWYVEYIAIRSDGSIEYDYTVQDGDGDLAVCGGDLVRFSKDSAPQVLSDLIETVIRTLQTATVDDIIPRPSHGG